MMAERLSPIASKSVSAGLSYSEKNQVRTELEDKKTKGKEGSEKRGMRKSREQIQTKQN